MLPLCGLYPIAMAMGSPLILDIPKDAIGRSACVAVYGGGDMLFYAVLTPLESRELLVLPTCPLMQQTPESPLEILLLVGTLGKDGKLCCETGYTIPLSINSPWHTEGGWVYLSNFLAFTPDMQATSLSPPANVLRNCSLDAAMYASGAALALEFDLAIGSGYDGVLLDFIIRPINEWRISLFRTNNHRNSIGLPQASQWKGRLEIDALNFAPGMYTFSIELRAGISETAELLSASDPLPFTIAADSYPASTGGYITCRTGQ